MSKAVIISRNGMGLGDESLALLLLRRYLKADLDQPANRYAFYNGGVKAALLDEECNDLLKNLEEQGSLVLLCGTCLDHFGLTEQLNVGKNCCIGDIRESMAMDRVDYL